MKVIFIRNTIASKKARKIGEIAVLPDHEAKLLIAIKRAELFVENSESNKESDHSENEPDSSDEKKSSRKKGQKHES